MGKHTNREEELKTISIQFPPSKEQDWERVLTNQINQISKAQVDIDSKDWDLKCIDIKRIVELLSRRNSYLYSISSYNISTIIAASSLGINARLNKNVSYIEEFKTQKKAQESNIINPDLAFQKGTLRSGEHLHGDGDILLLGDVNPGAKISAKGDIMIWGRLRGVAHAGINGHKNSKIAALQLRPLQLRICDLVARGPDEQPEQGLAEEAIIENEQIIIRPINISRVLIR
tara:strand:+ start:151 stop:843 length:693 start_codon:yes stop_codon:yes gene_type:complete